MVRDTPRQMPTIATVSSEYRVSPSQLSGAIPRKASSWFANPPCSAKIHLKTTAMATRFAVIGRNRANRTRDFPRRTLSASRARPSPNARLGTIVSTQ